MLVALVASLVVVATAQVRWRRRSFFSSFSC
jgi:hypothetical protein